MSKQRNPLFWASPAACQGGWIKYHERLPGRGVWWDAPWPSASPCRYNVTSSPGGLPRLCLHRCRPPDSRRGKAFLHASWRAEMSAPLLASPRQSPLRRRRATRSRRMTSVRRAPRWSARPRTAATPWCTYAGTATPACPWWTSAWRWR